MWTNNWAQRGACLSTESDDMFVRGAQQRQAKIICRQCPVKMQCLAEALDNRIEWGVWGGMTERERRALLRDRPGVQSWKRALTPVG